MRFKEQELSEEDKKLLEQFPKYNGKPKDYVGSREYWESIFSSETNRDPKLHEDFSKLHESIVNQVARFCKEHGLTDIDEFTVRADGLRGSIEHGKWVGDTDSSMSLIKSVLDKETGWVLPDRENPFLYEI